MKTKKIFLFALIAMALTGCEDFLDRYPQGGTLLYGQYKDLDGLLEGTTMGLYSTMYEFGGDHDVFGKRSIDMYGDLLSGDMAMASTSYGWFQVDEYGYTRQYRGSYIWSFYYEIIRLCNLAINAAEESGTIDLPNSTVTLTSEMVSRGYYYGEILAMRGYAYAGLMQYFIQTSDAVDYSNTLSIPVYDEVYTETDAITGAPRALAEEVYLKIEQDLKTAIDYLDAYGENADLKVYGYNGANAERGSKLEVNADVARGILAYAYLNWGGHDAEALRYATEVIDAETYSIIPNNDVLTNGFNDVNDPSWLWGQNVTIDNTTSLASFFGQVDIHSYSYAWAGDVKGVDDELLKAITDMQWDIRKHWWFDKSGNEDGSYAFAPTNKFFSATSNHSTEDDKIDRDWLSDNVFMRIESLHLIAAEACLNLDKLDSAVLFLDNIMSERIDTVANAQTLYDTYKASLAGNATAIKNALIYNWRTELWGEGYSLQTFRRIEKTRKTGSNHAVRSAQTLSSEDYQYTFDIPSSEVRYNRFLNTDNDELKQKQNKQ